MPAGTKVDRLYKKLRDRGYSQASAAKIAQKATGLSLATGKPPVKECAKCGMSHEGACVARYSKKDVGDEDVERLKAEIAALKDECDPMGTVAGLTVWAVDGDRIKTEEDMDFVEAGNGWRWPFIPKDELWLDEDLAEHDWRFCVLHEAVEVALMKEGMSYDDAHKVANRHERSYRQECPCAKCAQVNKYAKDKGGKEHVGKGDPKGGQFTSNASMDKVTGEPAADAQPEVTPQAIQTAAATGQVDPKALTDPLQQLQAQAAVDREAKKKKANDLEAAYLMKKKSKSSRSENMKTLDISSSSVLGGGINETHLVTLADGSKGVFKPEGDDEDDPYGDIHGGFSYREVFCYNVSELLGIDLVPVTTFREVDGRVGSYQDFVEGDTAVNAADGTNIFGNDEQGMNAVSFDFILGNVDRHTGNWIVDKDGGIHLIDNGYTMPSAHGQDTLRGMGGDFERFLNSLGKHWMDTEIPESIKQNWREKFPEVLKMANNLEQEMGGEDENGKVAAIELMKDRYAIFMNSKTLTDAHTKMAAVEFKRTAAARPDRKDRIAAAKEYQAFQKQYDDYIKTIEHLDWDERNVLDEKFYNELKAKGWKV